jgi:uncharacterized protein (TIGR02444 family)
MAGFYHKMQLDNPLWHYVSAVYSQPGVEKLCLEAQVLGLQVNTMLLCIWLATQQKKYDPSVYVDTNQHWRDPLLQPMRRLRYWLRERKESDAELLRCYESMKQTELEMERVDIALLWEASLKTPSLQQQEFSSLAISNMLTYVSSANCKNHDACQHCCRSLVDLLS